MSRVLPLAVPLAVSLAAAAHAEQIRSHWSFGWDPYPDAARAGYYELLICVPPHCWLTRVDGGQNLGISRVYVDPAIPGNGTAVVRACLPSAECSANSNIVTLDRTSPQPPTAVKHGFNDQI